ncbi:hypothetical protein PIB30_093005 [Stylosanthes scabra]|uniref:Bromo domain-containing protein n=1 Tax=Stylosanthes scabra TaxID=79078 RepID=A0ABU6YTY7_9FABA|nr:hypothetical protein [Stylosanthes scabra]
MDFGIIKYKLEANNYPYIEDFVADVRLVFSNSMTCNAPGNEVHAIAKELSQIFESKWEEFERNWKCEQDNLSRKSPRRFARMKINAAKTDKNLKDFKELVDEDNRAGMEIECPLEKFSFFNKDYNNVADNKDLKGSDDS